MELVAVPPDIILGVSDFVALLNQTLEYAYPIISVRGEVSSFKISKQKWVYFDLKDEVASVRFFGTVFQLPGPIEDGMMLLVRGNPKLHPKFGFSVNVVSMRPEGAGTIRRAAELLQVKLEAEGLFDPVRKRSLPYPPERIGLITSVESAAYADFVKILGNRWGGVEIVCADVQVQGEAAPTQICAAIDWFNRSAEPPDVLVIIRGGGSAEDLYAFNTESVTRAVAASRTPTLVAIGHEIDLSLAELTADKRASTPSNAAELLVPERHAVLHDLDAFRQRMQDTALRHIVKEMQSLNQYEADATRAIITVLDRNEQRVVAAKQLLTALDPLAVIRRGYAIVRTTKAGLVRQVKQVSSGDIVKVQVSDGEFETTVR